MWVFRPFTTALISFLICCNALLDFRFCHYSSSSSFSRSAVKNTSVRTPLYRPGIFFRTFLACRCGTLYISITLPPSSVADLYLYSLLSGYSFLSSSIISFIFMDIMQVRRCRHHKNQQHFHDAYQT